MPHRHLDRSAHVGIASRRIKVAVAVASAALDRLPQVLAACRDHGFEVETALASIGVLVGSVRPKDLERLRATPGVTAVEPERPVRLHCHRAAA